MQSFELVTAGRGWVKANDQWQEVTPGHLLWHLPGDETIDRSDPEHPYSCLAVRFQDPVLEKLRTARVTRWEELDEVRRFTEEVLRLSADDSFDPGVLLRYCISRLVASPSP